MNSCVLNNTHETHTNSAYLRPCYPWLGTQGRQQGYGEQSSVSRMGNTVNVQELSLRFTQDGAHMPLIQRIQVPGCIQHIAEVRPINCKRHHSGHAPAPAQHLGHIPDAEGDCGAEGELFRDNYKQVCVYSAGHARTDCSCFHFNNEAGPKMALAGFL